MSELYNSHVEVFDTNNDVKVTSVGETLTSEGDNIMLRN